MFVCYADESGFSGKANDPKCPYLVMAGVLVNTYNMHKTQTGFDEITERVKRLCNRPFYELKGQELYRGKGAWSSIDGTDRQELYADILHWFKERGHKLVLTVIDKARFNSKASDGTSVAYQLRSAYVAAALHLALIIQRLTMPLTGNKGRTLLIFDQQEEDEKRVSQLLATPPAWTDAYYGYSRDTRMSQIIDTAYFVRSHHASFVQIADIVAFVVNRHVQLQSGFAEAYEGERRKLEAWFAEFIAPMVVDKKHRIPNVKHDPLVALYKDVTPSLLMRQA
jgi:hypothetical protein